MECKTSPTESRFRCRRAQQCQPATATTAVSTWLNGGVPATTVAEWAGHSIEILLKIYAKCLDGQGAAIRARVQAALGHREG